jgi:hypothetical protein
LVVVDGSQATTFTVTTASGNTAVATQVGLAELRSGGAVKKISSGENATSGMPNPMPQAGTDGDDLTGGELAVLLIAVGGAAAAILYATIHNNDLNFGGAVTVVSPTK